MVAKCNDIRTGFCQLPADGRGYALSMRRIFPVDDRKVCGSLLLQAFQPAYYGIPAAARCHITEEQNLHRLLRQLLYAYFTDQRNLDLTRVGHLILDPVFDIMGNLDHGLIVDLVRLNHDADLTAGLDGKRLVHAS